ncbi:MAG: glycosyltransferase family 4 protein [Clostridia bacterium]|nr:glycosyltransferase family 4 protein [Clostridia bacterium]
MKILVICQYYHPEPFRISDICRELVEHGHDVTVVTGTPNYPMGEIYEGYENGAHSDEEIDGVHVHRCAIHPRKSGAIHRLWNYYSYPHKAGKYIKTLDDSFDLVFINQLSPVMMAMPGIQYAKKHGKRSVLYCLDLWPASLGAGGVNGGFIYKWFHRESGRVYRSVDKIWTSSESFADYFEKEFGITDTVYLPQYAEDTFSPECCRKTPDEYVDLMFAGNVGTAQSVDTIVRAAALCKDLPHLRWHIVGDGVELEACKALAETLGASVIFHGRKPMEEMPRYYAMADAMLVTMKKDPVISLTLPGKVQSYMAAEKPIIGAIDGETAKVISDSACGLCCGAEDAEGLAACARKFATERPSDFGRNGYLTYKEKFSKDVFIKKMEEGFFNACIDD